MNGVASGGSPRVVDLSFPIDTHFRWGVTLDRTESLESGRPFQTSRLGMSSHGFTHADAPAHVVVGGSTVEQVDVHQWVGQAAVLNLDGCGAGQPITRDNLEGAGRHVRDGDIVLIKTSWDTREDIGTPAYWDNAPYVDESGARWLLENGVSCVGFDFPQDHAIRRVVAGEHCEPHEFTTHYVLLRRGIGLLEYLCNLHQLEQDRVFLVAAPLRLAGGDGAPVRAIALEFH